MRVKSDRDRRAAERSRLASGLGDERLMAAVDAVEVAKRQDSRTTRFRRGIAQR